jgi:anaerobic selenocysteine-containing dehydrogenase
MKVIAHSVCALDCPDTCALQITVDSGKVVQLAGDPNQPITRGFACAKMYHYPERQEHPDRLVAPLKRLGPKGTGQFTEITWEEALDTIAEKLRATIDHHGPQAILPYCYAGTMGKIEGDHPLAFFRALGARELDQTICATTGGAGWEANYGPAKIGPDPADLVHARCIILWGIHALRSNSHLAPILKQARQSGAKILHIDPFHNETSRFADAHWQIRVGTDAALALAMGNEILTNQWQDSDYLGNYALGLEEYREACAQWPLERAAEYCGLPLETVRSFTREFATGPASFIKVGYGMTRNEGGGNAIRAITLLPALIGAWKRRGGGATISTSGGFHLNMRLCRGEHLLQPNRKHVNMNCLASALADLDSDPIKSLIVFNSNPAAVAPDSSRVRAGLRREDLFTVVLDHFQTDTADYADILLPATTFLEHPDLYTAYGHYYLQWSEPVVPPRGFAKPNSWVFSQLAQRLGLSDETLYWNAEQLAAEMLRSAHPWMNGISWERLRQEKWVKLNLPQPFLPYSDGSHFPDKKIRFSPPPQQLEFIEQPCDEYPFRLISPPGNFILNTSMGNLESIRKLAGGQPQVMLHPDDAHRLNIVNGAQVRLRSRCGEIVRQAIVSNDCAPNTIIALGQWWPKFSPDRKSLNDLTSERLTDLGGGSTFGNMVIACEAI